MVSDVEPKICELPNGVANRETLRTAIAYSLGVVEGWRLSALDLRDELRVALNEKRGFAALRLLAAKHAPRTSFGALVLTTSIVSGTALVFLVSAGMLGLSLGVLIVLGTFACFVMGVCATVCGAVAGCLSLFAACLCCVLLTWTGIRATWATGGWVVAGMLKTLELRAGVKLE